MKLQFLLQQIPGIATPTQLSRALTTLTQQVTHYIPCFLTILTGNQAHNYKLLENILCCHGAFQSSISKYHIAILVSYQVTQMSGEVTVSTES